MLPTPGEATVLYISGGGGGAANVGVGAGGPHAGRGGKNGGGGGGGSYVGEGESSDASNGQDETSNGGAGYADSLSSGWTATAFPGNNGGAFSSGAGGAASASTTTNDEYDTIHVTGGNGGSNSGGNGGAATLKVTGTLRVNTALNLTSGANGTGLAAGTGGKASLDVVTLIAPAIILTKQGGALSFNVTNLEINDTNTTLTANGIAASDANITNLRLTGNGNFTLAGGEMGNVSVGQLVIDGGTINSGNYASLIDGEVTYSNNDITLAGSATFDTSGGNQTVSRVLTGSGSLIKTGTGTLILTGTNDYTGTTTINGGTLQLADSAAVSTSTSFNTGTTGSTGTLALAFDGAFGGDIDGDGNLTANPDSGNTLTLSGTNSYTGMTTVQSGTLELGSALASTHLTLLDGTAFNRNSQTHTLGSGSLTVHGSATYTGELSALNATLNFYMPNGISSGSTLLNVDGDADISDSTVNLFLDGGALGTFAVSDTLNLISVGLNSLTANNLTTSVYAFTGISFNYKFSAHATPGTNGTLVATLDSAVSTTLPPPPVEPPVVEPPERTRKQRSPTSLPTPRRTMRPPPRPQAQPRTSCQAMRRSTETSTAPTSSFRWRGLSSPPTWGRSSPSAPRQAAPRRWRLCSPSYPPTRWASSWCSTCRLILPTPSAAAWTRCARCV
ncbi:hypothetical protein FACS1894116_02110 [Betaproteobacteria bacterium]|nr:hypothetical protein FACS1894116_02110 [Betaproteobacteria bacterium]